VPQRFSLLSFARQSKLTAALRDAIGGNSNTVMIANLWPEEAYLEECVSTLRFAARVRCLQTDPQVNESSDPLLALKKAERQIKELRQELAMRDMLSGRGRVVYEDLSDGERLELQQLALRFLSGGWVDASNSTHHYARSRTNSLLRAIVLGCVTGTSECRLCRRQGVVGHIALVKAVVWGSCRHSCNTLLPSITLCCRYC
jgi:kinesin family protein 6/9